MPKKTKNLLKHVRQWHYAIGALFACIFIFLATTGILINHGHQLNLDKQSVRWGWLNTYYGISTPKTVGFLTQGVWVSQVNKDIFVNSTASSECLGSLVGAFALDDLLYAVCQKQMLILTKDGELVESLGNFPSALVKVAVIDRSILALGTDRKYYRYSDDAAAWQLSTQATEAFLAPAPLPPDLEGQLAGEADTGVSWERVVLDLHSGRFFGDMGVLFIDLTAIALVFSSISGLWLWLKKGRKVKSDLATKPTSPNLGSKPEDATRNS